MQATAVKPRSAEGRKPALRVRVARAATPYLLIFPGAGWLALFFVLPLVFLAITSLESGDFITGYTFDMNFGNYSYGINLYAAQFAHSIEFGGLATLAALVIAYPAAYWIAFHAGPRKAAYLLIVLLPFFVSFVIRTISWETLLSDYGPLLGPLKNVRVLPSDFRVLATPAAVSFGLAYTFFPYMMLPIYASLEKIDRRLVESAEDLYSNRVEVFRHVIFPLSLPGVFAGVLLTGIPALADFINQDFLGGVGTTMVGRVIQQQFEVNTNYPLASALAFVFMVGLLAMLLLYQRFFGTKELISD
ncbi:MAG TPA: ABC transporter permease [Candidatus Dormibacteraeota bacterium]|nr:ABC transporter permease [Candidatus Dormibacteraeota bacterium]